jgi:hypothetical protein
MRVASLVGSGDKIALVMLPFVVMGVVLNVMFPDAFGLGGPRRSCERCPCLSWSPAS